MISEMLKVRDGSIRRILARSSTWVKVVSASKSWTTWLSTYGSQGANFTAGGHELWRVGLGKPAPRFWWKPVGRTVARVPVEEHMANYQAARALLGKGKSSAKKGVKKSAVKKAKPKK